MLVNISLKMSCMIFEKMIQAKHVGNHIIVCGRVNRTFLDMAEINRNLIDQIWDAFWTGGITTPITVLEQMPYLFFMKMLDDAQMKK